VRSEKEDSHGCDLSGGTGMRWIRGFDPTPAPRWAIRSRSPSCRFLCDASPTERIVTGATNVSPIVARGNYFRTEGISGYSLRDH